MLMKNEEDKFDAEKLLSAISSLKATVAHADMAIAHSKNPLVSEKNNYGVLCCALCVFIAVFSVCLVVVSDKQLELANEKIEVYRELQNTKTSDLQREISILRGRVDVLRAQVDKR